MGKRTFVKVLAVSTAITSVGVFLRFFTDIMHPNYTRMIALGDILLFAGVITIVSSLIIYYTLRPTKKTYELVDLYMSKTTLCTHCNKEIHAHAKFCEYCGGKVIH